MLLSAQFLAPGNGGICTVARMTAMALAGECAMTALACQDTQDHAIGTLAVRAFRGNRLSFVLNNYAAILGSRSVIYDFAGTARAHLNLPFARKPYAVWIHGLEVWNDAPAKYLKAVAQASLVLSNSRTTLERAGRALQTANVRICELGTVQDHAPEPGAMTPSPPTVLLLGRIDELWGKGHDILIEIWPRVVAAVPDARLLFVGGGPALDGLRAMVAASPARSSITVTGFVPEDELERYWRAAHLFAMLGDAEGFGLVYADAMRYGLPVIASREDAGQEVNLDGVTGFNVARADHARLVDVLVTLLRDRDLAGRLGQAGLARWRERYRFGAFRRRLLAATQEFLA